MLKDAEGKAHVRTATEAQMEVDKNTQKVRHFREMQEGKKIFGWIYAFPSSEFVWILFIYLDNW